MSVCTGAFALGDAGILKRKKATNHLFYDEFQSIFSEVLIQKNKRFVESDPVIITAGGIE
jgi:transcriptional regulator GlxA family with amidase domain